MKKLYYSISEISIAIDEEQHILRYWEKEFDELKPRKNRAGNRVYSEKELNTLKIIKKFLRDEKLSLKGAKEKLAKMISDGVELCIPEPEKIEKNISISAVPNKTLNDSFVNTSIDPSLKLELLESLKEIVKYLKTE